MEMLTGNQPLLEPRLRQAQKCVFQHGSHPVPIKCLGKPTIASWCGNHFGTHWVVVKAITPTWASRTTTKKIFCKLYQKLGFANPWVSLNQPSNCLNTVLPKLNNTYGGDSKQPSPQRDSTGLLTSRRVLPLSRLLREELGSFLDKECCYCPPITEGCK